MTLLMAGTIHNGKTTYHYIAPSVIIGHYVTDGDWTHPGECLTAFLAEQWATGGYCEHYKQHGYDDYTEAVWDVLTGEIGAWTLEYGAMEPDFDPQTQRCCVCERPLL